MLIPSFIEENKKYYMIIFSTNEGKNKELIRYPMNINEKNKIDVRNNIENFLEKMDEKIELFLQEDIKELNFTVDFDFFGDGKIKIVYNAAGENSKIVLNDKDEYIVYSNSLYGNLEKFYLYLYFNERKYIDSQKN